MTLSRSLVITGTLALGGCALVVPPERIGICVARQVSSDQRGNVTNTVRYENYSRGLRCTFSVPGNLNYSPQIIVDDRTLDQLEDITTYTPGGYRTKSFGRKDKDVFDVFGPLCLELSDNVNEGLKDRLINLEDLHGVSFWTSRPGRQSGSYDKFL